MRKKIFIVLVMILLVLIITCYSIYFLSTDVYIKIKYGKEINVEEKNISNDLSGLSISNNINNYIRTKEIFNYIKLTQDNSNDSKIYKNGIAYLKVFIDDNGNVFVEITNIFDSNNKSYLEDLENNIFKVNIDNNKAKYITFDENYLYILTESGKLYIFLFNKQNSNLVFENELYYFVKGHNIYENIFDYKIDEIINYYNNDENFNKKIMYALLTNGNIINVMTGKDFNEEEKFVSIKRFGNARIAINRDGTIQYCDGFDDIVNNCEGQFLGKTITDVNGKPIIISFLFEYDSSLYVIDVDGNMYEQQYDIENHSVIENMKKYNNKTVEKLIYVSEFSQPYMLKEMIIQYSNGTRKSFKKISRLSIYYIG